MRTLTQVLQIGICFVSLGSIASAQFGPSVDYGAGGIEPDSVAIADFDGDGHQDLAVTSDAPDKIALLFNQGDGSFGLPNPIFLGNGTSPHTIATGDWDLDGDTDMLVSLKNVGQVQVLFNNGNGTFTIGATTSVGIEPRSVVAADLDGDGDMDAAVANRDSNNVTILRNTSGSFANAGTVSVGQEPRDVAAGDMDQDGDIDLVVSNQDDRTVRVLNNSGSGTFSQGALLSLGSQLRPEGLAISDLDGNGSQDIAVAANGNGLEVISVFLNGGGFSGPFNYNTGGQDTGWITLADFDLDGDIDAATANNDSANISVLLNNGAGGFGAPSLHPVGIAPDFIVHGDLDSNGSADLAIANETSGTITVFLNENEQGTWVDLGQALDGTLGTPSLQGSGTFSTGSQVTLSLDNANPGVSSFLIVGVFRIDAPFRGGIMVPALNFIIDLPINALGNATITTVIPGGISPGSRFYLQDWIPDPNAIQGFAATNALQVTSE